MANVINLMNAFRQRRGEQAETEGGVEARGLKETSVEGPGSSRINAEMIVRPLSRARGDHKHPQANTAPLKKTVRIDVPPLGAAELKAVLSEPTRMLKATFESDRLVEIF